MPPAVVAPGVAVEEEGRSSLDGDRAGSARPDSLAYAPLLRSGVDGREAGPHGPKSRRLPGEDAAGPEGKGIQRAPADSVNRGWVPATADA